MYLDVSVLCGCGGCLILKRGRPPGSILASGMVGGKVTKGDDRREGWRFLRA